MWTIDGDVECVQTITTLPKFKIVDRVRHLLDGVESFLSANEAYVAGVAIEDFQAYMDRKRFKSLMLCRLGQGALIALGLRIGHNVILVSKGNESKQVAQREAFNLGYPSATEHEADAIRIGQLAGFGTDLG